MNLAWVQWAQNSVKSAITGIPRLPRFLVTRFHFARIFEAEFLYYKINIFFDNFFGYTMIHVARISRNAVFCLPQKTR